MRFLILTCNMGLLSGIEKWDGISIHHPQIPRPWNPLRASTVKSVTPPPLSSYVRVTLCGGGPGSYVDCATLSFQVPIRGSLSCADRLTTETTSVRTTPKVSVRSSDCIVYLLPESSLPIETPNARLQAPPMAGGRNERRLLAVACKPLLGQRLETG